MHPERPPLPSSLPPAPPPPHARTWEVQPVCTNAELSRKALGFSPSAATDLQYGLHTRHSAPQQKKRGLQRALLSSQMPPAQGSQRALLALYHAIQVRGRRPLDRTLRTCAQWKICRPRSLDKRGHPNSQPSLALQSQSTTELSLRLQCARE